MLQLIFRRKPELSNSVFYFCWQVCKRCFFSWKIANGTNWRQLARKRGFGRIQTFNFSLSCSCRSLQFQKLTIREIYLNITISVSLERAFIIKGILEWRKEVGTIILIRTTMLIIQIYRKRNHMEVKNWLNLIKTASILLNSLAIIDLCQIIFMSANIVADGNSFGEFCCRRWIYLIH